MLNYKAIGKQIKIARIRLGATQEYIAERANISSVHLSNIERGKAKMSLEVTARLASALCISMDTIMCRETNMPNQAEMLSGRMAELLQDCTPKELLVICEVAEGTKQALRQVYSEER